MNNRKQLNEIEQLIAVHNEQINCLTQRREEILRKQKMNEINEKFSNTFYKKDYNFLESSLEFDKIFGEEKVKRVNMMYVYFKKAVDEINMESLMFHINGDMNDTVFSATGRCVDEFDKEKYTKISKKEFTEAIKGKMNEFNCSLGINIEI